MAKELSFITNGGHSRESKNNCVLYVFLLKPGGTHFSLFVLRFLPPFFGSPFLAPKILTEHLLGVVADANLN